MISINPINQQNYFPNPTGSFDSLKIQKEQGNLDRFKSILENKNAEKDDMEKNLQKKRLMQASKAFEALLIKQVFNSMRQNLNGDQLIGENSGTKLFEDFLFTERSQIAANQSNLGIAKIIFDQQSRYLQ